MARIRHVAIRTTDVDRLVKFYTTTFGLEVIDGVGPATYLTDGYLNLAIIPERHQANEGINHLGFEVESVDALRPVCQEGGPPRTSKKDRPTGRRNFGCMTPTATGLTFPNTAGPTS